MLLPILLMATVSLTGCSWLKPFWVREVITEQPTRLKPSPTLEEVLFVVNSNSQNIRQLQTDDVTIRMSGVRLTAELALERPRNFRLRGGLTRLTGNEVDIGSNRDLIWFWVRRSPQPAVYYVQHDQFHQSAARQVIPVSPTFLIDALGMVQLDSSGVHQGPFPAGPNRLKLISRVATPQGEMRRVTVIDDRYGWVLEQEIYDARGQLLASTEATKHRYFPDHEASLPMHVTLRIAQTNGQNISELEIEIGQYQINQPTNSGLWQLPTLPGYQQVNLGNPVARQAAPSSHVPTQPPYGSFPPPELQQNPSAPPIGNSEPGWMPANARRLPQQATRLRYRQSQLR